MSTTRALNCMIAGAVGSAALGAAAGAAGAKILMDCAYTGYSVGQAAAAGATGNAVIGGGLGFLSSFYNHNSEKKKEEATMGAVAAVGFTTLGGMLGKVILDSLIDMPLDKMAAALATGGGAIAAGGVGLALVVGCCVCCCGSAVAASQSRTFRV
ncbi:MAG: hypothetical protein P4M12_09715 [Gammaproteobacteria bacterium]|nr:hypothetical protein [Gammaproteobacteria bacterium]